jgi:uncharacterized protein (TIGR00730 family)
MNNINKIAVFCGSAMGNMLIYQEASLELARILHQNGIGLVYGGGNIGLMGILADEMLKLGSEVTGVIPKKLVDFEVAHTGLTHLYIVDTMQERKTMMMKLSDAFIIMPGGIGTLDEFFEVLTYKQLGYHAKTIAVLNINGFYDTLIDLLDNLIDQGFLNRQHTESIIIKDSPSDLVEEIISS